MRKVIKKNIIDVIQTLYEAHDCIRAFIDNEENENANMILADCQQAAIEIGTLIEETEGEGHVTVAALETYCEIVYEIASSDSAEGFEAKDVLNKKIREVENSVKNDVQVRLEVVFMPYKASMWDSLESIWKEASADPECDVYVVPIPYYDRNPDYTFGALHYEGMDYPTYVPITDYEKYDLAGRCPDIIYIHNPYDDYNYVTSVDPRFYSKELKKYTQCLVYVPYFLFPKVSISYDTISTPVLFHADCIITQNEEVRKAYINEIKEIELFRRNKRCEVLALGTPKTDKIYDICQNGINVPAEWKERGEGKKKIFLNTNVSLILNNNEKFVENMNRVFEILKRRTDVFVIWREHPLTNETLKSMRPKMLDDYNKLKAGFLESGLGVVDANVEAYEAIYFSDCYFGAGGSLAPIYATTGKPMLLTAYNYPGNISDKEVGLPTLLKQTEKSMYFSERYKNFLDLFLDNIEKLMELKEKRYEFLTEITVNIDGTVGKTVMHKVKELNRKVK